MPVLMSHKVIACWFGKENWFTDMPVAVNASYKMDKIMSVLISVDAIVMSVLIL